MVWDGKAATAPLPGRHDGAMAARLRQWAGSTRASSGCPGSEVREPSFAARALSRPPPGLALLLLPLPLAKATIRHGICTWASYTCRPPGLCTPSTSVRSQTWGRKEGRNAGLAGNGGSPPGEGEMAERQPLAEDTIHPPSVSATSGRGQTAVSRAFSGVAPSLRNSLPMS